MERDWRDFRVGDVIDALDTQQKWYESTVRDVKDDQILVHYNNWDSKWDEWIKKDNMTRLAKKVSYCCPLAAARLNPSLGNTYEWALYQHAAHGFQCELDVGCWRRARAAFGSRHCGSTESGQHLLHEFDAPMPVSMSRFNRFLSRRQASEPNQPFESAGLAG